MPLEQEVSSTVCAWETTDIYEQVSIWKTFSYQLVVDIWHMYPFSFESATFFTV